MVTIKTMRRWLPFISSLMLGAAFLCYSLGFLALIGLVPLLVFIDRTKGRREIILFSWLSSLFFYALVMSWILAVDSGTWSGISSGAIGALKVTFWLVGALVFSVAGLFFGYLTSIIKKKNSPLSQPIIFTFYVASAWVISEFIRSWLFSLFWASSSATFGPHWNFGNLGLGAVTTPLVYSSRLVGFFGLTFLVIVFNFAIFWGIKKKYKLVAVLATCVFLISVFGAVLYRSTDKTAHVGIVQLPKKAGFYHPELAKLIAAQGSPPLNLLVLPEYANFLEVPGDENTAQIIKEVFKQQPGAIVYSRENLIIKRKIQRFDNLIYADSAGQVIETQGKHFLVPTGEYMPEVGNLLLKIAGQNQAIDRFNFAHRLEKAANRERVVEINNLRLGGLACSGVISAKAYQNMARQNSDILINSASLTVFEGSETYFSQTKAMARFHAVAHNQPFIQATAGGYSYIIDKNGRFLVETTKKNLGYYNSSVRIGGQKSLYTKLGDYFVVISILIVAYGLLLTKNLLPKKLLLKS